MFPALAVALFVEMSVPMYAAAQESGSGSRVAVILFLSYEAVGQPPPDLGNLQGECWDRLATGVHELGHSEVSRSEIGPSVRRWAVRTDLSVSGAFLEEIATELDAGVLLVCNLTIYGDRLLLCGRSVVTATGKITWADIQELRLPPGSGSGQDSLESRWRDLATSASHRLLGSWDAYVSPDDFSGDLFVVPVRTVGMELMAGRLVQSCLLRSLMRSRWRIEEPGVTFSRLQEAGVDPRRLDRTSRPALIAAGVHGAVLVCDLVAGDNASPARTAPSPEGSSPVQPQSTFPPSTLSMRLLNVETGVVVFAATEWLEMRQSYGLFGTLKDASPMRRVQPVADRLVRAATRKG